jgi:hypothetical protein
MVSEGNAIVTELKKVALVSRAYLLLMASRENLVRNYQVFVFRCTSAIQLLIPHVTIIGKPAISEIVIAYS